MVSRKWQRFCGGVLSGATGGAILVATGNLGIEAGVEIGFSTLAVIALLILGYAGIVKD